MNSAWFYCRFPLLVILMVTLLLTLGPTHALAQTVRGTVVDAESGVPIHTAEVILVGADDRIVARFVTDSSGRFAFRVGNPGSYRLHAMRIGYTRSSSTITLQAGQDAVSVLRLQASAIPLDSLATVVEGGRPRRLIRVGFYQRQMKGFGYFLTPEDLQARKPIFHEDLFYSMAGIRVLSRGRVLGAYYKPCSLSVTVDGLLVEPGGAPRSESSPGWIDLVHVNDIEAIEVYPRPGGVPVWLAGYSPCGAILVWTKGSPR